MVSQMHTEEMELNIELGLIEVSPISNGQLGVIVLTKAGNERLLNHILKLLDTIASQS